MPLYEYQCDACGRRFEAIQKFADPVLETCRLCERGPVRRLLSSPAIQFKGSGWYITDYAQKGKSEGAKTGGDGAASDGAKTDTSKGDSGSAASAKTDSTNDTASSSTSTPAKAAD